jgi:ABC-type nitrate/sulfonate/bicarbonate transport system permease component
LPRPVMRATMGLIPIVVVIVLYQLLAIDKDRVRIFPQVPVIWDALVAIAKGEGELGNAYGQILQTSFRLFTAFGLAFLTGIAIGIAAGRNKIIFSFVENLVWIFMAVPSVVWVFLFAVGLGLSPGVPIGAVTVLLIPQFVVLVAEGAKSVPADLVEMARSYKVTKWQRLTGLFLPFLVPYIIAASRTAFATAVKVMLIAEVIGQPNGIGFEVSYWYGKLFMGPILAWGITMIVLGLVFDNLVFGPIEKRVSGWKSKPIEVGIGGLA